MAELAHETGLELFTRRGRGLQATAAALQLSEQAGDALAALQRVERTAEDMRRGQGNQLTLSSFSSAAKEWLPHVVAAVRQISPGIVVEISLNEAPAGSPFHPPDIDVRQESLEAPSEHLPGYLRRPLGIEEFDVALPAGHHLESRDVVAVHELAEELWVDHDIFETPASRIIRSACRAAGFTPNVVARLDDHYAALSLVEAGVGITVLTRLALQDAAPRVSIRSLHRPAVQRRVVAHVRQERGSTRSVSTALKTLHRLAADAGLRSEEP